MRSGFVLAVAFAASVALANVQSSGSADRGNTTNRMDAVREAIARRERLMGGFLSKPGSGEGRIVFVDCQDRFRHDALQDIARQLGQLSRLGIAAVRGEKGLDPASARKAHGAEIALTMADRPGEPLLLLAPEDGWGMVNVARIPAGDCFAAGCSKALLRAFGLLCCGGISMQQGNIMSEAKLENTSGLQNVLPQDVTIRQLKYLADMGVKPQIRATYKKACEEGWAPAPTNDVQKAIWEKVKSDKERGPTNPITIPPPKKVK